MATKPGTRSAFKIRGVSASKAAPPKAEDSPASSTEEGGATQPALRKTELIDLVVERSGAKKKDVKTAIEATLAVLGEALAEERELNLRPFGKLKVTRRAEKPNGTVLVCRVRQPKPNAAEPDGETS